MCLDVGVLIISRVVVAALDEDFTGLQMENAQNVRLLHTHCFKSPVLHTLRFVMRHLNLYKGWERLLV